MKAPGNHRCCYNSILMAAHMANGGDGDYVPTEADINDLLRETGGAWAQAASPLPSRSRKSSSPGEVQTAHTAPSRGARKEKGAPSHPPPPRGCAAAHSVEAQAAGGRAEGGGKRATQ